jgi:transposase-like protein
MGTRLLNQQLTVFPVSEGYWEHWELPCRLRWQIETVAGKGTLSANGAKVEQADDRWWFKYSPEFKRQAVDRMMAGESVSALAKELRIARKFFYAWREAGYGSAGAQAPILLRRRLAKERREAHEREETKGYQKLEERKASQGPKKPSGVRSRHWRAV